MTPQRIRVTDPPIGSKCWVLEEKGLYILAESPGILRGIACTHAGSGAVQFMDGVPDENGFFPGQDVPIDHPEYHFRDGRSLFRANPTIMGMWMLDAGFVRGLTVFADGGTVMNNVIITITWMEQKLKSKA